MLDIHGSLQLLTSSHVRERDKALLGSIMVGGVWNGFLLGRVRSQSVPCRFCGAPDGDGHLFWECTFPPLVEIRENPEFHDLIRMDKGHWPPCLLWHGWLPKLSGTDDASPWAVRAADSAGYLVESALGSYSSSLPVGWGPPVGFDAVQAASLLPDSPDVETDGSLVIDRVTGVSSAGAGFFAHLPASCWIIGVGVMLIRFARLVIFSVVGDFSLFLRLSNLFRELSCGVSFLLHSLLVLSILVLII